VAAFLAAAACAATLVAQAPPQKGQSPSRASEYIDPFSARPRVVVMTDIANEPDDQMSLVRFLVYANEFDVEGLVATTSTC